MPQVIPMAVGAVASAAGATALEAAALSLVASVLVGSYQQQQAKKKARAEYNASQMDRLANVVTTTGPRELVLGRVRKGGAVPFRGSAGQYKQKFFVHLTLAAHEIDGVEAVWFNDQRVTIDPLTHEVQEAPYMRIKTESRGGTIPVGSTDLVLPVDPEPGSVGAVYTDIDNQTVHTVPVNVVGRTVFIPSGITWPVQVTYQTVTRTPLATVHFDLGAPGSTADWTTKQWFPDLWTDAHRGEGIAKLIAVFDYDDSAYPNGVPNITALIRGAKVYDPRDGVTRWSDNPALLARHVYQHERFGKATVSAAEEARFITAANVCDTSQNWTVDGVTIARPLYRAGMVVPFGSQPASVLDDLAQAMAGMWAFAGGELYIRAGAYTAPVMTFGDDDLAVVQHSGDGVQQDKISISVHRERAEKFNTVNARIWDEEQDYKEVPLSPLTSAALVAADGEVLAQEVSIPAVPYSYQALHIAGVMMRDARDPLTIEVPLKMRAYPIELFDVVEFSFARYGWSTTPKAFIVLSRVWDRERGVIRLTAKETSAAIFNPDASFSAQGFSENTAMPDPWDIDPPGTLTISSGTDDLQLGSDGTIVTRVRVTWPEITDQRIEELELQWSNATGGAWNSIPLKTTATEAFIVGVADGQAILVRARSKTPLATSDWGAQQLHMVVGKTAKPSDVTSFAVNRDGQASWVLVGDADVRAGGGYLIRWQPGTNRSWGDASLVHDGVITDSPYSVPIRPAGQATFLIKAVDSTGNESETAAVSVINLGDPVVENVILSTDYKALGFPGTVVNATVSGGDLVADADPSPLAWDANDATAAWTLDTDAGWTASTYKPVTYTPDVYIVTADGEGAQLTLPHEITATAFLISYRRDGDAAGWTSDAEPGWTDDAAQAWDTEEYRPWPGTISARAGRYEFQITTQSRDVQSVISTLRAQLDVPDVLENLGSVSIAPGGTVLTPTKTFRAITGINLTLVADGGGATNARVESLNTRTVTTRDASGASVAGTVLATLQGY